ncbi:uncharacterized protein LOC109816063 [Cajanus cajan]|uniref:Uncharacterized protein n=1 Tax=Cajanus cajan TaxID=3821 RepID=A0A151RSY9_CAJCA|nr:uncharacterized protein LOC109816063 [Cajanus cajan]KYP45649.1 hypothetical protein KK1_032763 [Cajanus cajan]
MYRNGEKEEKEACCYFHPKQVVVGVCPLCLNERLLELAAKQDHHRPFASIASHHRLQTSSHRNPIHKIFAFGSLFSRHQFKSHYYDQHDASPSPEESFISIKFEENGVASWEKGTVSNKGGVNSEVLMTEVKDSNRSVIEHGKSNNAFRWRKRMGRLVHLIQWKRSSKGGVGHVGNKVEGVKVRKGWMRTLTKRKTVE